MATEFATALTLDRTGTLELGIASCSEAPRLAEQNGGIDVTWSLCSELHGLSVLERSDIRSEFSPIDSMFLLSGGEYTYRDEAVTPGGHYLYRMRVGETIRPFYTRSSGIHFSTPTTYGLSSMSVFPNPASSGLSVRWHQLLAEPVTIMLHDVRGRLVYKSRFETVGPGVQVAAIDPRTLARLSSGVYLVSISDQSDLVARKLVVLR
jgi:hypothetical protein